MSRHSILRKAVLAGAFCAIFAGPASAESFAFANFHALVTATGTVARGSGVKAVTHPSVGRYRVQFTRRVNASACVYTATPQGANGGQASVQVVAGQPDTIAVFTFSSAGVPANRSFNLLVSCSDASVQQLGAAIMSASIRSDGVLFFGSGVVSSSYNSSYKEYSVKFTRSIYGYASIVTPWYETAVAMTYESNVATRDGLFVALTDDAGQKVARNFHLIVFCPT